MVPILQFMWTKIQWQRDFKRQLLHAKVILGTPMTPVSNTYRLVYNLYSHSHIRPVLGIDN